MNIFSVLNTGKSRIHEPSISAMFAYLINPNQNHGLGSKFIDSFLELANTNGLYQKFIKNPNIKFEIDLEVVYNYNGKRNNIDVQIKILDSNYVELHRIIIENKIKQGASNPKQLKLYYEAVLKDTENNDDPFELSESELSVIFLTPKSNKGLADEWEALEDNINKVWLFWIDEDEQESTIVHLIQSILKLEQEGKISPINEYMKHTLKAFTYHIIETMDMNNSTNRVGKDIGDIKESHNLQIKDEPYVIVLRDSGQIQLFNNNRDKVTAKSLLLDFLKDKPTIEIKPSSNTRKIGKEICNYIKNQKIKS